MSRRLEDLVMRMQADFLDNPQLALTAPVTKKRFGVDGTACDAVLAARVEAP